MGTEFSIPIEFEHDNRRHALVAYVVLPDGRGRREVASLSLALVNGTPDVDPVAKAFQDVVVAGLDALVEGVRGR